MTTNEHEDNVDRYLGELDLPPSWGSVLVLGAAGCRGHRLEPAGSEKALVWLAPRSTPVRVHGGVGRYADYPVRICKAKE